MATKKQADELLQSLNATIEVTRDPVWGDFEAIADAPRGFVFSHIGTHCVSNLVGGTRAELWQSVLDELSGVTLEPCPDPECDICHPDEDED